MRIERIKSRGDKETAAVCTRPNLSELVDGERENREKEWSKKSENHRVCISVGFKKNNQKHREQRSVSSWMYRERITEMTGSGSRGLNLQRS